ncbi:cullin-3A-like protein isoform X1, partial [Tanacetum coccineum]
NADYMVLHNSGEKLYVSIVTSHIKQMAASIEVSQGSLFLEELNKKWMEHEKAFDMLGVTLWVDNIINYDKIEMKLKAALVETEPISTHINEDNVFTVNEMFSSKCYKVKVGNGTVGVANMESEPKKKETVQTVEKDRKQQIDALISNMAGSGTEAAHKEQDPGKLVMVQNLEVGRKPQIDASILKILKANGIMDCNDLVREVTKHLQSRIRTNSSIIKRIITPLTDWATCKGTQKMEICFDTQFEGKNDIVEFYGD